MDHSTATSRYAPCCHLIPLASLHYSVADEGMASQNQQQIQKRLRYRSMLAQPESAYQFDQSIAW